MADVKATFDKRFKDGVSKGEYVTRRELEEILTEVHGERPVNQPQSTAPGSSRRIG